MTYFQQNLLTYDALADKAKKKFEAYTWRAGIWLGVAAVVVFALCVAFGQYLPSVLKYFILPILEVALIGSSVFFLAFRANGLKADFLAKRHFAEYHRINVALEKAGMHINYEKQAYTSEKYQNLFTFPLDVLEKTMAFRATFQNLENAKNELCHFVEGQMKYHSDIRIEGYKKKEHQIHVWLNVILYVFLVVVATKCVLEIMEYFHLAFITQNMWLLQLCIFLVILLPPVYAALEGIVFFSEWKRNVKISEDLHDRYQQILEKVRTAKDQLELEEVSLHMQKLFWEEQLNWVRWFDGKKVEARV